MMSNGPLANFVTDNSGLGSTTIMTETPYLPFTGFSSTFDKPLKSPLRYPGGKSRVAKRLIRHIPPHRGYCEVMVGGGGVFFAKPKAEANWINDLQPGLYAFYKALRDYPEEFVEFALAQQGDLQELFDYWAGRRDLMEAKGDERLVERAVQYYYLNRTVWGGRVVYDPDRASRLYFSNPQGWSNLEKKMTHVREVSAKLQGIAITCCDFADCVNGANEDAFIYVDPPYYRDSTCSATDKLYDKSFLVDDHRRLAGVVRVTSAKVMLSYDDCPEVRELYRDWRIEEDEWIYCGTQAVTEQAKANGIKEKKVKGRELLIFNYGPEDLAEGKI